MAVDHPKLDRGDAAGDRLQFGLGTMLALTALVAVASSLMFRLPSSVATPLLALLTIALPVVLTAVVIYGRGYWRTFCIGALFPSGAMLVCTSLMLLIHSVSAYQNSVGSWAEFTAKVGPYYRPYVGVAWLSSVFMGLLSVLVRYLTERAR